MAPQTPSPSLSSLLVPIVAQFGGALVSTGIAREACIKLAQELEKVVEEQKSSVDLNEKEKVALLAVHDWVAQLQNGIYGLELPSASLLLSEIVTTLHHLSRRIPPPLPFEIIRLILHELSTTTEGTSYTPYDLKRCSLVHSSWTSIAQQLVFSSVAVRQKRVPRLTAFLDNNPEFIELVKSLYIHGKVAQSSHSNTYTLATASLLSRFVGLNAGDDFIGGDRT